MILFQFGHNTLFLSFDVSVSVFSVIAFGVADSRSGDTYIKSNMLRVFGLATDRAEVGFSYLDSLVAYQLQYFRQRGSFLGDALPVPVFGTERGTVVAFRINPVGRAVPYGILFVQNGSSRGRADTWA